MYRWHWCWRHLHMGDLMLVTIEYFRDKKSNPECEAGDWNVILETGNSPTYSVSKIRHQHRSCTLYDITSTLTAIIFLHYKVATNMALDFGVHHVQGPTMMVDEPTTWSIQTGWRGWSYFSRKPTVRVLDITLNRCSDRINRTSSESKWSIQN